MVLSPSPKLDEQAKRSLSKLLHENVDSGIIPATFIGVTDATHTLYFDCAGDVVLGEPEKGTVDVETTLQLFSATKFVTAVACLQLVDRGLITLDDPSPVSKHLPELADLKVIKGYSQDGQPILEGQEPKNSITLRMLLIHISGLSNALDPGPVQRWALENGQRPTGFLAADATLEDFTLPLTCQPGTDFVYGSGLDWAGFLLERVTGQGMADYFRENIFEPCGMTSTSFYPTKEIKAKLMRMTYDDANHRPHALSSSFTNPAGLSRPEDADTMGTVLAGGAGLYSTAQDYLAFLRGVLASSPHPQDSGLTAKPLLSHASFREIFTESSPLKANQTLTRRMRAEAAFDPEILEDESGRKITQAVGLILNLVETRAGRKAGSGLGSGAARTMYWMDPATGIASVCFTNIFAEAPCPYMDFYAAYEAALYKALRHGNQL